jgi:quinol-cytochrome oxidoreductase complex cytochrome b subunit
MIFYQVNGFINVLAVIFLVIMVFLLHPTAFRLSLRVFALSELFIILFYILIRPLLVLSENADSSAYIRYLGIVSLIIPAVGFYIAITALKVINKQQLQKPFSETENADWPPYDKPNL